MSHEPFDDEDSEYQTALFRVRKRPRANAADRHLLVCTEGKAIGQVHRLAEKLLTVGRAPDSGLHLDEPGVSRRHAQIRHFGGQYILEDEGSANGTFVHDQRVETHLLQHGDVVGFGPSATFRYSIVDAQQERMLRTLFDATITDALTGVGNRAAFDQTLEREETHARAQQSSLSLLMIDIDHFKEVNDTYGHAVGDAVLREVAQRLQHALRTEDLLCRYGGEEFAVILAHADPAETYLIAERLRTAVGSGPIDPMGATVTVSIGIACLDHTAPTDLVVQADANLYKAKANGRDRVVA